VRVARSGDWNAAQRVEAAAKAGLARREPRPAREARLDRSGRYANRSPVALIAPALVLEP